MADQLMQRLAQRLVDRGRLPPGQRPETYFFTSLDAEATGPSERICRPIVVTAARRGEVIAELEGLACLSQQGWVVQDETKAR